MLQGAQAKAAAGRRLQSQGKGQAAEGGSAPHVRPVVHHTPAVCRAEFMPALQQHQSTQRSSYQLSSSLRRPPLLLTPLPHTTRTHTQREGVIRDVLSLQYAAGTAVSGVGRHQLYQLLH